MPEHSPLTHGGIAEAVKDRLGPSWCIAATDIADELYPLHSTEVARLTAENAALQAENERLSRGIDWAKADGALRNENAALRATLAKVHELALAHSSSRRVIAILALIEALCPELKGQA